MIYCILWLSQYWYPLDATLMAPLWEFVRAWYSRYISNSDSDNNKLAEGKSGPVAGISPKPEKQKQKNMSTLN